MLVRAKTPNNASDLFAEHNIIEIFNYTRVRAPHKDIIFVLDNNYNWFQYHSTKGKLCNKHNSFVLNRLYKFRNDLLHIEFISKINLLREILYDDIIKYIKNLY